MLPEPAPLAIRSSLGLRGVGEQGYSPAPLGKAPQLTQTERKWFGDCVQEMQTMPLV